MLSATWRQSCGRSGRTSQYPLFVHRYHDRYVDQFLPIPLGPDGDGRLPSGSSALLASALFAVRAVENRDAAHRCARRALTAGFAGADQAVQPDLHRCPDRSSRPGAPAVGASSAAGRSRAWPPRSIALALWKYRGLRATYRLLRTEEARVALGRRHAHKLRYKRYIDIDWQHLRTEPRRPPASSFWSVRVRSVAANCRRHCRGAPVLRHRLHSCSVFWFWALFVILKGSTLQSTVDSGSFFRFVLPAIPCIAPLAASVPLLIPKYGIAFALTHCAPAGSHPHWSTLGNCCSR